jgi:uncharacterized membrane protein YidH (DUF202 family)
MLQAIIDAIVTTVQGLLGGLGTGIVGFFEDIFVEVDASTQAKTLSSLGIFLVCLLGITIALAAVRWVTSLVRGGRSL